MRLKTAAIAAAVTLLTQIPALPAMASEAPLPMPKPGSSQGTTPTGLPEVKVRKETAIAMAKTVLNIPSELGEPSVSLNQSTGPYAMSAYNLRWAPDEKSQDRRTYDVSVSADTGDILSYSFRDAGALGGQSLAYTREEALAVAQEVWLKKLAPGYVNQLSLRKDTLEGRYFSPGAAAVHSFRWERTHDGAVTDNGVTIAIDATTGALVSYSFNWTQDLRVNRPATRISLDEAQKAFGIGVPFELAYRWFNTPGTNDGDWRLVYQPVSIPMVDGANGKLITYTGKLFNPEAFRDSTKIPSATFNRPAVPLTSEQALALARQVFNMAPDKAPSDINYGEGTQPKPYKTYSMSWNPDRSKPDSKVIGHYYSANIDAINGTILNLNSYGEEPTQEQLKSMTAKLDAAGAKQMAIDFLVKYRPDLVSNLRLLGADDYPWARYPWEPEDGRPIRSSYSVRFQRMNEGIPVQDASIYVEVDLFTGQLKTVWADYSPHESKPFPARGTVIPSTQAMESFVKYVGLRAMWTSLRQEEFHPMGKEPDTMDRALQLVYVAADNYGTTVDAITGHLVDGGGRDLVLAATRPMDLKGHWAEREIELMLARGVFEPTGAAFNPGGQVTRGDAARWLVLAKGLRPFYTTQYSFDFAVGSEAARSAAPYAEAGLKAGIFSLEELGKTFEPEKPITREEFALWSARAMGYGRVADMEPKITLSFSDELAIGARYRNAVALMAGLKILKSIGGEFRPQAVLTRAEASKFLYGVASQGQGFQPPYMK